MLQQRTFRKQNKTNLLISLFLGHIEATKQSRTQKMYFVKIITNYRDECDDDSNSKNLQKKKIM